MMLDHTYLAGLGLQQEDIALFSSIEATMQYYAELSGADMFIGCFTPDQEASIVVAEAKPCLTLSNYKASVLGQKAIPRNEPAVFAALKLQMPVWDTMAITQEKKTVRQDVVPLKNCAGKVIGTLICERDISADIRQEQKYEELVRMLQSFNEERRDTTTGNLVETREIHHRVKNNLQMVASILNIQARRSNQPVLRNAFKENVSRILSIAEIYDILVHNSGSDQVSLLDVVERIRRNIETGLLDVERTIMIQVAGDDVHIPSDRATLVAIVANELISNAAQHAFTGRDSGEITVVIRHGNRRSVMMVEDNGIGFDSAQKRDGSLGLELVKITVQERLRGSLHVVSDEKGTKFSFDFLSE